MIKQNKELKQKIENMQKELTTNNQLKDKIEKKQEKKHLLSLENTDLDKQVQMLTEQVGKAKKIKKEYQNLEAETEVIWESCYFKP